MFAHMGSKWVSQVGGIYVGLLHQQMWLAVASWPHLPSLASEKKNKSAGYSQVIVISMFLGFSIHGAKFSAKAEVNILTPASFKANTRVFFLLEQLQHSW